MILTNQKSKKLTPPKIQPLPITRNGEISDIREIDLQNQLCVHPVDNPAAYQLLKKATPARLGMGRAGLRYTTRSILRLRADHAAAQDSVLTNVPAALIQSMGMLMLQSECQNETDYLTRPDHGRKLQDTSAKKVKHYFPVAPTVLLAVGDGLSSEAITANITNIIPAIKQGLNIHGISIDTLPFIRFCRVAIEDQLGALTGAKVVCLLIGERPGLVTPESMSAYIAYRPTIGMPEANRTVVSNIHTGGIPAVEAGAYISEMIWHMLTFKSSGLKLKQALKNTH